ARRALGGGQRPMNWWMTLSLVAVTGAALALPGRAAEPTGIEEKAKALIDGLATGNYAAAGKDFDDTVKKAFPADKMEATWKGLTRQVGAFRAQGPPRVSKEGKDDVVIIPCEFEKLTLDARVAFNADKQVSGFRLVPHQSTEYKAPAYVKRDAFTEA